MWLDKFYNFNNLNQCYIYLYSVIYLHFFTSPEIWPVESYFIDSYLLNLASKRMSIFSTKTFF